MVNWSFDAHLHTHYSYDSLVSPSSLIKRAIKVGLSAIVVTDHNTIRGGLRARETAMGTPLEVFVGTEIRTDLGDIIGLFVEEEIRSREYNRVIDEIKGQGGIVYLPHPFARHTKLERMNLGRMEVIEAFNGRQNRSQNERALELAKDIKRPVVGGSDAHILYEIGTVRNCTDAPLETEEDLRRAILVSTPVITVRVPELPLLPRFKMTQYMSWIRIHNYQRLMRRVTLFTKRSILRPLL